MEWETVERVWFIHVCRDFFIWRKLKLSALTHHSVMCAFSYGKVPKEGTGNCVLLKFHDNCYTKESCFL